ncbi:hypothetical protein, partial [Staphylococcus warneri]|uniref:hypothetical protein n=1 Tax=Staphylococcus warneri TaxID=1292 RepID=UPI0016439EC5
LNKLLNMPYPRETLVSHIPQFSLTHNIIHIYPLIPSPLTIQLFHTQIHSIPDFHLQTQPSNHNLQSLHITTPTHYIITHQLITHLQTQLK